MASLNPKLAKQSALRKISLNRLEKAVAAQLDKGKLMLKRPTTALFIPSIHAPFAGNAPVNRYICYGAVGILQEGLRWASGGKDFKVEEVECQAMGADNCVFHIYKEPLN